MVTQLERSVLERIRDSEYQDSATGTEAVVGKHVWIDCLEGPVQGKQLGGVLTSLGTKGLVEVHNTPGEQTVALTEAGLMEVPF